MKYELVMRWKQMQLEGLRIGNGQWEIGKVLTEDTTLQSSTAVYQRVGRPSYIKPSVSQRAVAQVVTILVAVVAILHPG